MLVPGMRWGGGRGFPACTWNFSLRKRVSSHSGRCGPRPLELISAQHSRGRALVKGLSGHGAGRLQCDKACVGRCVQ